MEVEIFTLSDFAQDNNGKLTIVGTFDTINVQSFPTASPPCSMVLRMRGSKSEAGHHSIRIRCVDESNIEIPTLGVTGDFNFMPNPQLPYAGINVILGMKPISIERAGGLTFELYIDNEWSRAVRLTVNPVSPRIAA